MTLGNNLVALVCLLARRPMAGNVHVGRRGAAPHANRGGTNGGVWVGEGWIRKQFPSECADAALSGEPVEITSAKTIELIIRNSKRNQTT